MIENNKSLNLFLKQLQKIPYLASKNIYLVTQYFLDLSTNDINLFCDILKNLKENNVKCQSCFVWREKDKSCNFCESPKRDKSLICVVENWRDVIAIERTGVYKGLYHILGGAICPLEGIGPQDLNINKLLERVIDCKEVIFALNQTPEGEATIYYIVEKLKKLDIKISCIARGLPVGSSIESMDLITVSKALSERRIF